MTTGPLRYDWVAIGLHWLMVIAIGTTIGIAWSMTDLPLSPEKFQLYALHKSIGLSILAVAIIRLVWRLTHRPPPPLMTSPEWQRLVAAWTHRALYLLMLLIPLSGIAYNYMAGFPLGWFGLISFPAAPERAAWKSLAVQIHYWLGWALIALVALHAAAALYHYLVIRDRTLWRMLPILKPLRNGVRGLLLALALAAPMAAQAASWTVDPATSTLGFKATLERAEFSGSFARFTPVIEFDPADLATAKVSVSIDISSIATGATDRDREIPKPDWFDTARFPKAEFATTAITRSGPDAYTAAGTLTIRDKTVPVTLPFTLKIEGDSAVMDGSVTIDRTSFGIGQGQWAQSDMVGKPVTVIVHLAAKRAG